MVYTYVIAAAQSSYEGVWSAEAGVIRGCESHLWVLEIEPRSSARAAISYNQWVTSPALKSPILKKVVASLKPNWGFELPEIHCWR